MLYLLPRLRATRLLEKPPLPIFSSRRYLFVQGIYPLDGRFHISPYAILPGSVDVPSRIMNSPIPLATEGDRAVSETSVSGINSSSDRYCFVKSGRNWMSVFRLRLRLRVSSVLRKIMGEVCTAIQSRSHQARDSHLWPFSEYIAWHL
jgi:hypothetical protein